MPYHYVKIVLLNLALMPAKQVEQISRFTDNHLHRNWKNLLVKFYARRLEKVKQYPPTRTETESYID